MKKRIIPFILPVFVVFSGFTIHANCIEGGKAITINSQTCWVSSDSMNKQSRQLIVPTTILKDTTIKNETNLVVEELYSNYHDNSLLENSEINLTGFVSDVGFYQSDTSVFILIEDNTFIIRPGGLEYCKGCIDLKSKKSLSLAAFGKNMRTRKKEDGTFEISYPEKDFTYRTSVGKLVVHTKRLQCMDTGNNPITISHKNKKLEFNALHNIYICEYDSDKDGKKELYIVSYQSCEAHFKIYRIKRK